MLKKLLFITLLCIGTSVTAQECPNLLSPVNGAVNVPVDASITWESVDGVSGYRILVGTSEGGSEFYDRAVGRSNSYTPPLGLPENTEIYVTIILEFFSSERENIVCSSQTFSTEDVTTPPGCTTLKNPVDGAINVHVSTNIVWNYAPTAVDYTISLGSEPGENDILSPTFVRNGLSYNPDNDLPANTTIYVNIIPLNENGVATGCVETSFTTGDSSLLECTRLTSPINGAINVPLVQTLQWAPVTGALGYQVVIGTSPDSSDIIDSSVFTTTSIPMLSLEPNQTYYVLIVPYNSAGFSFGCIQETFSTELGCGTFTDVTTGQEVSTSPIIDFPDTLALCSNELSKTITTQDIADGYRWYQIDGFGNETLISEMASITFTENGRYRYEAYNTITQSGVTLECTTPKEFSVVYSEIATIDSLSAENTTSGLQITVNVSGAGDYEYAIDDVEGPYQNSNTFSNVQGGTHIFYVRDKNGCGIVKQNFSQDLSGNGFPKFFTPNGDNINDFWQYEQPKDSESIIFQSIRIFNRYGVFIKEITLNSMGWDGNFKGRPQPSGNYWFEAVDIANREVKGYFALKR